VRDEWKRTIRTAIQSAIALAPLAPILVPALGISATATVGATIIAIAAAVTRVMQVPQVTELLNKYFKIPKP